MARNDARPTGEEAMNEFEHTPERNQSSDEPRQGESCGTDLDTEDNWVQQESEDRGDSER